MPLKDKTKRKVYLREWSRKNRDKLRANNAKFGEEHPEYHRNYQRRRRREVLRAFGGKCVRCGFSDWRALQVDHINGGGSKIHREKGTLATWKEALDNRDDHQLLCANCNWIKRYENDECAVNREN